MGHFFLSNLIRIFEISNKIQAESPLYREVPSYRQSSDTPYTHFSTTSQSHCCSNQQFIYGYKYNISFTHFLSHLNMHNLISKQNMQKLRFQTQNSKILYSNI